MVLNIIPIGTITPRVVSAQLHANTPADALNADNLTGCLAPRDGLNEVTTHQKSGDLKTLFKLGSSWIAWDDVVDVVRSQVTLNRFYYTGDTNETGPRKSNAGFALFGSEATWPTLSEPLGITPPTNVLTVEELGTEDEDVDEAVISYVYTYVTDWEEESAPSEVSTVTTLPGGKYTALSNMAAITDDFIDKVRFYRVEAGESGSAEYMAIAVRPGTLGGTPVYDLPASSITGTSYKVYDANHASTPTGLRTAGTDICPSEEWAAPPEELTNLTQYLNGVMIGSVSNVLYMSEPMIPYAWPDAYQQKF